MSLKNKLKPLAFIVLFAVFAWFVSSFVLFLISGKMIYRTEVSKKENHPFKYERSFSADAKGDKIEFLWIPTNTGDGKKTFLYLHGNNGRLSNIIEGLSKYGNVLSPAYPGYSSSTGEPNTETVNGTVDVSMKYLKEKGVDEKDIIIIGHSLGGAPAVYAAGRYPNVDRVILVSTFSSIRDMCEVQYSILCIFSGGIHNSKELAPLAKARVRVFHDPPDKVVPYRQGRELFELIGSPDKKFYDLAGTHSDFKIEDVLRL